VQEEKEETLWSRKLLRLQLLLEALLGGPELAWLSRRTFRSGRGVVSWVLLGEGDAEGQALLCCWDDVSILKRSHVCGLVQTCAVPVLQTVCVCVFCAVQYFEQQDVQVHF